MGFVSPLSHFRPYPAPYERGQLQKGAVLDFRILPRKGSVLGFRILSSLLPRPLLLRLVLPGPHPILPDPLAHVACALQVQAVGDPILAVVRLRRASPPFPHRLSPSSRAGFFPGQRISSSAWGPPASPAKPFPPSMLRNLRDFETQPSESRRAKGRPWRGVGRFLGGELGAKGRVGQGGLGSGEG